MVIYSITETQSGLARDFHFAAWAVMPLLNCPVDLFTVGEWGLHLTLITTLRSTMASSDVQKVAQNMKLAAIPCFTLAMALWLHGTWGRDDHCDGGLWCNIGICTNFITAMGNRNHNGGFATASASCCCKTDGA
jgi:uncharacterized membrane-anchored protein YitT (DUF2179 family)